MEATNYNNSNIDNKEVNLSDYASDRLSNAASLKGIRYKANFMSPNLIDLSKQNFAKDKISFLSKGIKYFPTPKYFNKVLLRGVLENFGRKLRFKWFFCNDERQFDINPFKEKSKSNPGNDAAIKFHLSRLEEETHTKNSYSDLTKGDRYA